MAGLLYPVDDDNLHWESSTGRLDFCSFCDAGFTNGTLKNLYRGEAFILTACESCRYSLYYSLAAREELGASLDDE